MKLTAILSLAFALQVSASGLSQTVTYSARNMPLKKVFSSVESQTGYVFFYDNEILRHTHPVTIFAKEMPLPTFIKIILKDQPIDFFIENQTVVIRKKSEQVVFPEATLFKDKPDLPPVEIRGRVVDEEGEPLENVSILIVGTQIGTVTNGDGNFTITAPDNRNISLEISNVGYQTKRLSVGEQTVINVMLKAEVSGLSDVVVVGYGTQRKADITGSVASVPQERFDKMPNVNVAQAIQGSTSGIMVQTSSASAKPTENLMVRGRNSITASNSPLVVIDGIPGSMVDVTPNDVQSIEILKDASASAIYGSRGANGVILITTKKGEGKTRISYDGYYSTQNYVNLPDYMTGDEFYNYMLERDPSAITGSERQIYEAGTWVNWADLTMRQGASQQHRIAVSGSSNKTRYFISGTLLDVKGLMKNDNYLRFAGRINLDTKIGSWLTIGTNTNIVYEDQSGRSPSNPFGGQDVVGRTMNPLTTAYDADGNLTIYPWPEDIFFINPLAPILYDDLNKAYSVVSNNYAVVDFPFLKGLSYRLNTGIRMTFDDAATYIGRNTKLGLEALGIANTSRSISNNQVIENILTYKKDFGSHNLSFTGLYSFQGDKSTSNAVEARSFPHDLLSWYAANESQSKSLVYSYSRGNILSQMGRINYGYDSRYLLTMTFRRDGYSGFGENNKWGSFPALALGWNVANETFFPWKDLFSQLKLRASWGKNGNQAVNPYNTISRLTNRNNLDGSTLLTGYFPSILGQDRLGWETTETVNLGLDFGLFNNRITGDINLYRSNTTGLLLARSISAVHGISSIVDNIGKTRNRGIEFSISSKNIVSTNFSWSTSGNISYNKNEIISLYGLLDKDGNEINDINNNWFVGHPVLVTYGYAFDGVWQLNEAAEAATWGSQPGYVKIKDLNNDGILDANDDRTILGRTDPNVLWGMSNTFTYKNFTLNIFIHGVHGSVLNNPLLSEDPAFLRRNVLNFNHWTPDNPTNKWVVNQYKAWEMAGRSPTIMENAGFIRVKDISFSYDFSKKMIERMGLDRVNLYVTARNLFTITKWTGMDPELLTAQQATPLQRTYLLGLQLGF